MCIRRVPSGNSVALLSDSAESESTLALCFIAFSWCEPVSTSLKCSRRLSLATRHAEQDRGGDQSSSCRPWADLDLGRVFQETGEIGSHCSIRQKRGQIVACARRDAPRKQNRAKISGNHLEHDLQKSCGVFGEGHATNKSDRDHERSSVKRSWSKPRSRPKPKGVAISTAKAGHPPASRKSS